MDWGKLIFWGIVIVVVLVVVNKLKRKNNGIGASEAAYGSQENSLLLGADRNVEADRGAKEITDARQRIEDNNKAMQSSAKASQVDVSHVSHAEAVKKADTMTKGGVL